MLVKTSRRGVVVWMELLPTAREGVHHDQHLLCTMRHPFICEVSNGLRHRPRKRGTYGFQALLDGTLQQWRGEVSRHGWFSTPAARVSLPGSVRRRHRRPSYLSGGLNSESLQFSADHTLTLFLD